MLSAICLANGQHKELAVPDYSQKSGLWCWAASMDMIMEYHQPINTSRQCMLVEQYMNVAQIDPAADCSDFCIDPCADPAPATYPSACNLNIPYSFSYTTNFGMGPVETNFYEKSFIDILFTENDFYSMEDHRKLTWDQYTYEIDHCRPVIFLYSISAVDEPTKSKKNFVHATVGKGYTTVTGSDATTLENYFMIQDPWDVCDGESYLLHENALSGQAVDAVGGILVERMNILLSMVHHIFPKGNTCDPCEAIPDSIKYIDPKENLLLEIIRRNRNDFLATANGSTFDQEILLEYLKKGHFQTKIELFNYDFFNTPKKTENLIHSNAILKTDLREVTYIKSKPALSTSIVCSEKTGKCAVEKIRLANDISPKPALIRGDTIWLSNNPYDTSFDGKKTRYSIVRFPPYTFEFYRFSYENEIYYLPTEGYAKYFFYGGKYQNSILGIPEPYLLKGLEKFVLDFDQPKLIDKSPKYREKVQNILQNDGILRMDKLFRRRKL
ncbi:hypothetical protein CRP01_23400 [Flavilitoribacter nigricans DSM 23189 = NBRC 102662]|uniref:Uncharacterized protein n=2 Tax=Flavilitoribacter TaxID=2762562 RepID=A0A2D0N6M7_FLAN2|nr:hypothetical protein CRP01_23400 [Flavilitoribacter nigricans DSM 23189 = NBRC 102662]